MRTHISLSFFLAFMVLFPACQSSDQASKEQEGPIALTTSQLADSMRYFRRNHLTSDLLSRSIPELGRQQAFDIQLAMLDKELAEGAKLMGWKMGGTATAEEASFDPVFGYILDRNMIPADGSIDSKNFPGGSMLVEGEIGFVIKHDLKEGVASKAELMDHIDYMVGAVEFAQSTAVASGEGPLDLNYVVASGMGQVATIKGTTQVSPQDFDFEKETVSCYINETLAAEGVASNIFGNPLNAVYELANLLPTQNRYLKAGDLVITGSLYQNPSITGPAKVRLEFSTLGTIAFESK